MFVVYESAQMTVCVHLNHMLISPYILIIQNWLALVNQLRTRLRCRLLYSVRFDLVDRFALKSIVQQAIFLSSLNVNHQKWIYHYLLRALKNHN